MPPFIRKNFLLLCICIAGVAGFLVPEVGIRLRAAGLVPALLCVIFLAQGMSFDSQAYAASGQHRRALIWGGIMAYVLAPAAAWGLMEVVDFPVADRVGFLLMCAMAPTLVSGVVIADQAGGDHGTAVVVTIVLNLCGVALIPLILRLTLGPDIDFDHLSLLLKLLLLVLLPAVLGQLCRRRAPAATQRLKPWLKYGPMVLMATIVFMSVSSQAQRLRETLTVMRLLALLWPALTVHLSVLVSGFLVAKRLLQMTEAKSRSIAILCSEKTLAVGIAVWSTEFAETYPAALVAAVVFHFGQIYADGLIARYWSRRPIG